LVEEERFREDLFYRLNIFPINVPPLRERREDIPELVRAFIQRFAASEGKAVSGVDDGVMDLLVSYPWPGNVRQLENAVFRAVVMADGETLKLDDFGQIAGRLAQAAQDTASASPFPPTSYTPQGVGLRVSPTGMAIPAVDQQGSMRALRDIEDDAIRIALDRYNGQMSEVARRLGIGRSTLYRKIRDLGINVDRA
jgi:DNA-binding NtrC family response regulator